MDCDSGGLVGIGLMLPPAVALGLMAVEGVAGTASAVMGAMHMVIGAAGAALVGAFTAPAVWVVPIIMLGFALWTAPCLTGQGLGWVKH